MNQNYYSNLFTPSNINYELPLKQTTIQNILRLNKGKKVTLYTTFNDLKETFNGIIEQTNLDHIIISNPESGNWYLIPINYLDYIKFYENVNFNW